MARRSALEAANRYRQETKQGRLLPQPGKAASTNLEYKENQAELLAVGSVHAITRNAPLR